MLRTAIAILALREYYKRPGYVNIVVFSCDAILGGDGNELKIYYSALDTSICIGTSNVNELMRFCTIGEY